MNITYTIIPANPELGFPEKILRSDGWYIPTDPANSDYQAYLATLATESAPQAPTI